MTLKNLQELLGDLGEEGYVSLLGFIQEHPDVGKIADSETRPKGWVVVSPNDETDEYVYKCSNWDAIVAEWLRRRYGLKIKENKRGK